MSTTAQTIFTVSQLNRSVRILLEQEMGLVWLAGEISNLTQHSSGHWYLTLKDDNAQVRCAMFRGQNRLVRFRPQNGLQVLVQARLSLYEPRGEYQLVLERMQPAGDGLQQLQLEQLRQKLQAEGLFDAARKRPLPAAPQRIGLITSPTGAAIHDMLTVLGRRAPQLEIILYPSQVQGPLAPPQLCAALAQANQRQECDVLIIGRGGGAAEDLNAFNDEAVVRAIAGSTLPIISAVGHESDVTLADFAADLRAATPSAAAELVSPDRQQQRQQLQQISGRLAAALRLQLAQSRQQLARSEHRLQLQHPARRLEQRQQRLDELAMRLRQSISQQLQHSQYRLQRDEQALSHLSPQRRLAAARQQLAHQQHRLLQAWGQQENEGQQQLRLLCARLQAISPLATLARGYSVTLNAQGDALHSAAEVKVGDQLATRLQHGSLQVTVTACHLEGSAA